MNSLNKRKLKYGSAATAFVVLFIAAVIALNVFAGYLSDRFLLEVDMAHTGLFDLSDDTVTMLSGLTDKVTITVLDNDSLSYTRNQYGQSVDAKYLDAFPELFKRYAGYSNGNVTVRYVDPYTNPTALQQYSELGTLVATNIVVEGPHRSVVLDSADFFALEMSQETYQQSVSGLQAEQKLTSAITYVMTEKMPGARFIEGHNETAMAGLSNLLKDGNYDISNLNLSLADIDDTVNLIVIASPKADYTADEIKKLDAYFDRGGNAIVALDPETPSLPTLERYLEEWGVKYEPEIVLDDKNAVSYQANIVSDVQEHDITKNIVSGSLLTLSPSSRPIKVLWDSKEWRKVTPILVSSDSSYGKSLSAANATLERQDGDTTGPFNVSVLTAHSDPNNKIYSNILFCATYAAEDNLIGADTFGNKQLFAGAIKYFNPTSESVIIAPKKYTSSQLSIQSWQSQIIFWLLVVIIPLMFLVFGIVVWLRRKNK